MKRHQGCFQDGILEALGDDILLRVLDNLNDTVDRQSWSLVCKHFYRLESACKRKIQLLRGEMLPRILRRYSALEHLDLSLCPQINDRCLGFVAAVAGLRLRSIDLSRLVRFSHLGLSALAKGCQNLVEIDVSYCARFGDMEAAAVSNAKNLQTLKLVRCQMVSDLGLGWIAVGCGKLQHLNLRWCVGVGDLGVELVAIKCKELRSLDVSYLQITNKCIASITKLSYLETFVSVGCVCVDDKGLTLLKNGCKSLQRLDVSKCQSVSSTGIISLASGCIALQQLSLAYCVPVTNALLASFDKYDSLQSIRFDGCEISRSGLKSIGKSCKSLKELSLSKCNGLTDEGISVLVGGCRGLKMLDITCCHDLTDVAITAVATSCGDLSCLKMESCALVTETSLNILGDRCPLLEVLDLTDCSVSNTGLKSISRCTGLTILKLGLCENISNEGLIYIGAGCSNLQELDLYRSVRIGDTGLAALASGCPKLRIVNLSYCIGITDDGLKSLARLDELYNLEIRGCFRVTSTGLSAIALGCKHLVELDIKRCYRVDDMGIVTVVQWCINLRQINISYCPISDVGFLALVNLSCLQNVNLVHLRTVSLDAFAFVLLGCESLKKVKLLKQLKSSLPSNLIEHVENKGCRIRWVEKPFVM